MLACGCLPTGASFKFLVGARLWVERIGCLVFKSVGLPIYTMHTYYLGSTQPEFT